MIRKFVNFASTVVAVLSMVVATQVADAQIFAGSSCCGPSGYSSYASSSSYGYGYAPSSGYYGGASVVSSLGCSGAYGSCGTPVNYETYGIPACNTGCYGTTSYTSSGCGLFGHRLFARSSYSSYAMGYPSCAPYSGCPTYGGYAVSSGCGYGCASGGLLGCRHRTARCGSSRRSACCLLSNNYSYIGTTAACCAPMPNISSCMSCGGYTVQPEYSTSAPVVLSPTPAPATVTKPTPEAKKVAPNPLPPEEPKKTDAAAPAPAPEPGN